MNGRTKALLPLPGGDTFLTRIVKTMHEAGVEDVVAVIGHEHDRVAAELSRSGLPVRPVLNARYHEGQLTSLLAALEAIDRSGVDAMLMTLVDVPLVNAGTVRAVLDRYREHRPLVVRPVRGEQHGHPVVLDRSLFALLRAADPASGAKPIVRAHVSVLGDVAVNDDGAFNDIDTPDAYRHIVGVPLEP